MKTSTRVSAKLSAREFNRIASRYMDRPTFVTLEKMSDGKTVLFVRMDRYGSSESDPVAQAYGLRFSKEHVPEYVAAIDKYLSWGSLAKQRGDAFTREIATAPAWGNGGAKVELKFALHSGNEREHFLAIVTHAAGVDVERSEQFYDETNAANLRALLWSFAAGALSAADLNSAYK